MKKRLNILIIAILLIFISSCGFISANKNKQIELVKIKKINCEVKKIKKVSIYTDIGNISVKPSKDNFINIKAIISVQGNNEKDKKEFISNVKLSLINKGDKLFFRTYPKNNKKQNIYEWKAERSERYKHIKLDINYIIEIPKSIIIGTIENDVGNISVSDLIGLCDISTEVGSIKLNRMTFIKKSIIKSDTGNVKLDILNLKKASKIYIETEVGNIKLNIPKNLKYYLKTKAFMKKQKKQTVNGGGTLIIANTDVGGISISN